MSGDTIEAVATRIESEYRLWLREHGDGKVIITQGVGPDGHTAGILPYPNDQDEFQNLFVDTERFVIGYDAGNRSPLPLRVTVTVPFLARVDESILYACGEVKRSSLEGTMGPEGSLAEIPGRVIHTMRHVTVFTDLVLTK
jgi:6-phosphogluconolactonase/glucosamine-6-phosphate isomerase/deaminase